jgi:hypothetical protein
MQACLARDLGSPDGTAAASGVRRGSFAEKLSDCSPRFQGCKRWLQIACAMLKRCVEKRRQMLLLALRSLSAQEGRRCSGGSEALT